MKILITGGKGQLGSDCARLLGRSHDIAAPGREELDVTRPRDVEAAMGRFSPGVIINCAGFTRVDACETEFEAARRVNAEGAGLLARVAAERGCRIIHISTDYVFDGRKTIPEPYLETDAPNPLSCYGITKLEGEAAVRKSAARHIILRTAWVYGISGGNFPKTILRLALEDSRREIKVVNDQFGSPTWSHRLALQIDRLMASEKTGTFHASAEGYCTWYALAVYFLSKMEVPCRVVPCTSQDYPTPAARPKNSILENRALKSQGLNVMRPWQEDMDEFVFRFRDRLIRECRGDA